MKTIMRYTRRTINTAIVMVMLAAFAGAALAGYFFTWMFRF